MANPEDAQLNDRRRDDATLECNAFRALLLGVCQNLQSILTKVDSYEELLLDEMESRGCDTTYLLQEQNELRGMARLTNNVLENIPAGGGPRVNLATLLTGVIDRFRKALPPEQRVLENLTPELYVRCDTFELQETLLDMLERFSDLSGLRSKNWQVILQQVKLNRNEMGILQYSGGLNSVSAPKDSESEFCVISILPEGVAIPELRKLHPFRELLADASAGSSLRKMAGGHPEQWRTALLRQQMAKSKRGHLFPPCDRTYHRRRRTCQLQCRRRTRAKDHPAGG